MLEGKNVVLVDDMVDTAGTLSKAADLLIERGAKSVRAICTHPVVCQGMHMNAFKNQNLEELIVTDTIPNIPIRFEKIKVLILRRFICRCYA